MIGNNSKTIEGQWFEGLLNGICTITWKGSIKYVGYCVKENREGFGIIHWPAQNKIYLGFWKNNKQEGVGMIISSKSVKYGFWSQGERMNWFYSENDALLQLCSTQERFKSAFKHSFMELINFIGQ